MKRPHRSAFTLVELLVVLGVIGVLTALLMGVVAKAKEHGSTVQSSNNIRQLAVANIAYAADNGTYAPAFDQSNNKRWCGARTGSSKPFDATKGYLSPYFGKSQRVTPCPILSAMPKASGTFEDGAGGYGYNAAYIGGMPKPEDISADAWNGGFDPATKACIPSRPARVTHAATTVMFASTAYARQDGVQEYPFAEPPFWDFGDGPSGFRPSPSVHFRFRGKALVAWCDAHVTLESPTERPEGTNPHGGEAAEQMLGWFGPDEENGYWNPGRSTRE